MTLVRVTSEIPLSARRARTLAATPDVMEFVLAPVVTLATDDMPPPGTRLSPGLAVRGRLRWFGVIPAWTHRIEVVRLDDLEIYTHEHGGPIRVWNHRLTFEPTGEQSCRYTDEIELDDSLVGRLSRPLVRLLFRHRHRRWRQVAAIARAAATG
ncbi:hypothetical protein [Gordonia zhaorongruii]|uniref:hypothetical protein n=1 Tax=Gordonia zhaorongruii TaxID=2597659 RepID=UPI001049C32C